MDFLLVGVNHASAPIQLRERMALPGELSRELLRVIHGEGVAEEALVLDTCNRTEFYLWGASHEDPLPHLLQHLADLKDSDPVVDLSHFYRFQGAGAVRHLFRVAAGLDSQMIGEHEILGQVKEAYREALQARTARFFLNKLLHRSFRTGKRVRSETGLGEGAASVAGAAVHLAREMVEDLADKTVLLLGAGETAQTAARALWDDGAGRIIVANRTISRARELCRRLARPESSEKNHHAPRSCPLDHPEAYPAEAVGLPHLPEAISRADIAICSTGSSEPVLGADMAGRLRDRNKPLCVIDIAVPRDVAPELGELDQVRLRSIDDLEEIVESNADQRRSEIPHAEAIVDKEVQKFLRWQDSLQVTPTIKLLARHLEDLQDRELARQNGELGQQERERLREYGRALCNKILHEPFTYLRRVAEHRPEAEALHTAEIVREMFGLSVSEDEETDGLQ